VGENDNLSFLSDGNGNFIFGTGEKWDTPDKALRRLLLAIILPIIAIVISAILIHRKRTLKLAKIIQEAANSVVDTVPYIDLENMGLTSREKEICELLLTDRNLKDIAHILNLSYAGATFHARNLYAKLGIKGRTELLVRVKSEK
jgi:DNA-binding CsgD family transcriptional regulator